MRSKIFKVLSLGVLFSAQNSQSAEPIVITPELREQVSELFVDRAQQLQGPVVLRSMKAKPKTQKALGCLNLRSAEASSTIYEVWKQFKNNGLKKKLVELPGAPGLYMVPPEAMKAEWSPPNYRLTHILYGRDMNYQEANSDLFMGIYEPLDGVSSVIIAFKGSTPDSSDWFNNLFNRGAENVRDFFGLALKDEIANPVRGYLAYFKQWFDLHNTQIITYVGHSLGGALAESMARFFSVLMEKNNVEPARANVIVYNSLGAAGMLGQLGKSLFSVFKPHQQFDNIRHEEFVTKRDPLQLLNRLLRMSRFNDSVILPTTRTIQADGTYKPLGWISEHYMENILADVKTALRNDGLAHIEALKVKGFAGSDEELKQALNRERRTSRAPGGRGTGLEIPTYTRKGRTLESYQRGRKFLEKQKELYLLAKPVMGVACQ